MSLEDDISIMSQIPVFAAIGDDARRLIAFSAETRMLRAGDVLFRRGDISDGGYILVSGTVFLDASDTGSPATEVISPYTLIGEMALLSDTERPATAVARQPATVLKISRVLFHRVLKEYPESAARLRAFIGKRVSSILGELDAARRTWKIDAPDQ